MQNRYKKKELKPVNQKALEILLYKDRTRYELTDKLFKAGYTESEIESAIVYVEKYGYINDQRYAANYINYNKEKFGRAAIYMDLKKKGIAPEIIETELSEVEFDEQSTIYEMLLKRAGEPHKLDEKEYRRLFGFFARRGFSAGRIHKALKEFSNLDY